MRTTILALFVVLLLSTAAAVPAIEPRLVALSVADLDATISWYQDNLGFRLKERKDFPQASLRIAFMESNGFELEVVEDKKSVPLAAIQKQLPSADDQAKLQGFVKLAFTVDDLTGLASRMKSNGVRFQMGLTKSSREPGVTFFIVRDNDGNWLQFFGRS